MALRLAEASMSSVIDELRRESVKLKEDLSNREMEIASRRKTGELAQKVIDAVRDAADEVAKERLVQIQPILHGIYARLDPHPTFRLLRLLSRFSHGKGQLATVLEDSIEGMVSEQPGYVLSSSQLNALSLSLFLSFNLGMASLPLDVAMIDDPLQSLDDINLLGLVDLLRRLKTRRQVVVSTHDLRFGGLLSRKLRPSSPEERTIRIELNGWGRPGPTVQVEHVLGDPAPYRLTQRAG